VHQQHMCAVAMRAHFRPDDAEADQCGFGAVKVFPSNATDVQMAEFQKEVVILKSCRDRNIVQFLGACITDTQTCLVTE